MAKRSASSQLTHDNWDQEEEPEEVGTFKTASSAVLEKRVIRVAKRRANSTISNSPTKNVFSGFTGFGSTKPMASASEVANTAKSAFSFLISSTDKKPEQSKPNSDYLSRLRSLNEDVVAWINKNVSSSPCCILTPVFQDYEKYLGDIQKEFGVDSDGKSIGESSSCEKKDNSSVKSGDLPKDSKDEKEKGKGNSFVFGVPKNNGPLSISADASNKKDVSFSFGSKDTSSSVGIGFGSSKMCTADESHKNTPSPVSFNFSSSEKNVSSLPFGSASSFFSSLSSGGGSTEGFSFGSLNKPAVEEAGDSEKKGSNGREEEPEEDEPPKNDFTPVKEDDAVFTQRVKVFVKKDNNFKDHGVGNLYLKETPTGKYQALVRADTSLGNILFNVILSKDIPTKRVGKNNVMLIVIPTPDFKPPPVPVLLRVKTAEDADTLIKKIEDYKK